MPRRVLVPSVAAAVILVAVAGALLLPMYTCPDGYRFERFPGPGGDPTCSISDMGYQPRSWLPTKLTVAGGGTAAAIAVILWTRRRRLTAIGLLLVLAAVSLPWFIRDGWEPTMRNGQPVCCGNEIDRGPLRAGIVVVGASLGAALAIADLYRSRRSRVDPVGA